MSAISDRTRTTEARQHFFGENAVDEETGEIRPDAVVLSWFGVAGFALAAGGRVLLLDAWIPRGLARSQVPATVEDLVALAPDALLIGHGHFDHAADAATILKRTDATLVAAPETSIRLRSAVGRRRLSVVAAVPAGAEPGARADHEPFDGVAITAVRHIHSRLVRPEAQLRRVIATPDPWPLVRRPARLRDLGHLGRHLLDEAGPSVLYQVRAGGVSITWHDTTGPLPERAPAVLETLAGLPPTDVQVPALMGFNQLSNGFRDVRRYVEAVAPRELVPCHHDHWLPPLTAPGDRYAAPLEAELDEVTGRRPLVRFLADPADYVTPITLAGASA